MFVNLSRHASAALIGALVLLGGVNASAASLAPLGSAGYAPRVPVSPLAFAWFDPSRLQVSTSITVGSSSFSGGANGLQVTSLSYRFDAPLWMRVSLGNAFGAGVGRTSGKFFLEGIDAAYRPMPGMEFQVHYRDLRTPLQYSPFQASPFDGTWGR